MNASIQQNDLNKVIKKLLGENFCTELIEATRIVIQHETGLTPEAFFKVKIEELRQQKNNPAQKISIISEILQNAEKNGVLKYFQQIFHEKLIDQQELVTILEQLQNLVDETQLGYFIAAVVQNKGDWGVLLSNLVDHMKTPNEFLTRFNQTWKSLFFQLFQTQDVTMVVQKIKEIITSNDPQLSQTFVFTDLNLSDNIKIPDALKNFLDYSDYQLPAGVMLIALGLQGLIEKINLPQEVFPLMSSNKIMAGLFTPFLENLKPLNLMPGGEIKFNQLFKIFSGLLTEAETDESVEWALLKMARFPPVGIFLVICAVIHCLIKHPLPWWDLLFADIEKNPKFKVKRLPPPSETGPKYLIFSDIHRDSHFDVMAPMQTGSIDHFMPNQPLYCRLLDYALKNGFTVIEAGDCEELWFFRDFSKGPKEKLEEIIKTHECIYKRLVQLHRQGRYIRLYGNHDCCVRKPSVFQVLQKFFDKGKKPDEPAFEIYDFAIIEAVKTMDDMIIHFGLDSEPYKSKAPMIVAHGHQWDFWNCDCNNIIGKLIVSAVVTPLDMLDDPFRDMGGIAWGGSPATRFTDVLANTFVLESFLSAQPAAKFAHEIQHQKNENRHPNDTYMFMETIAALAGATIGVRKTINSPKAERFNLVCLGHTHYPQSQPYFNLGKLEPIIPDSLNDKLKKINEKIKASTNRVVGIDNPLIKSRYFNSGTAGWMEGVVWAIQIDETGQARQVYWTHETQSARPHTMDWELPLMDPIVRKQLQESKWKIFRKIEDISVVIDQAMGPFMEFIVSVLTFRFDELFSSQNKIPAENNYNLSSNPSLIEPLGHLFWALFDTKVSKKFTFQIQLTPAIQTSLEKIGIAIGMSDTVRSNEQIRLAVACLLISRNLPLLNNAAIQIRQQKGQKSEIGSGLETLLNLALLLPSNDNHNIPLCSKIWIEGNIFMLQIQTYPPKTPKSESQNRALMPKKSDKSPAKPNIPAEKKDFKQQICEVIEIIEKYQ